MKFSCRWLAEYVDLGMPDDRAGSEAWENFRSRIARDLTFMGHNVEDHELDPGTPHDLLLDVDVTTNRVDAMGHLGLARDLSALYDRPLRWPEHEPAEAAEATSGAVRITIEDGRCARFSARVIKGVRVGESPEWLKRRLEVVGARPINNVVDVTNYVLWELGKPIHAYDLATLAGAEIRVRAAREGEELVTLDEEERRLDPEILVIADAERPVGVGGVMGGLDTEVTTKTVDVLIESAHFEPRALRRGARRLGMHTDASHRFERGSDPEISARAASRAAWLIREIAGGEVLAGVVDVRFDPEADWRLEGDLVHSRLEAFMGVEVDRARVESWLSRLGFELERRDEGSWRVRVPSWRYYDFQPTRPQDGERGGDVWEADLFEEVARLHGLEGIPAALPALAAVEPPPMPEQMARRRMADHLAACGYAEAINFAFIDPTEAAHLPSLRDGKALLGLVNPLSERYSVMRSSLLPGLVESARFNQRRGVEAVRLFELGRIFFPAGEGAFPDELEMVALVAGGALGSPWERRVDLDFYDLKGAVESLAHALGARLEARPAELAGFLPGAGAELVDEAGRRAGFIGRVLGEDDPYPLFAAEVTLSALMAGSVDRKVEMPSRYPGVAVDLTLTHSLDVSWGELSQAIEARRPADLRSFALTDRYQGEGVPEGAVNTTISFFYNAPDRSLTQDEVNQRHQGLTEELQRRFGR